jgi:hypothetical protein
VRSWPDGLLIPLFPIRPAEGLVIRFTTWKASAHMIADYRRRRSRFKSSKPRESTNQEGPQCPSFRVTCGIPRWAWFVLSKENLYQGLIYP